MTALRSACCGALAIILADKEGLVCGRCHEPFVPYVEGAPAHDRAIEVRALENVSKFAEGIMATAARLNDPMAHGVAKAIYYFIRAEAERVRTGGENG